MKTWLITGCSSGFGKNLAETLLSEGEQVVVTARKPETIQHFAEKYPQTALCLRLDVTKKDTIDAAVNAAIEKFGKIDVLINNAGYCLRGAVEECTEEEIYVVPHVRFRFLMLPSSGFLRPLREHCRSVLPQAFP